MENCLCTQTIVKSVILPCDVYVDGEYTALYRRSDVPLLCYFEQDSTQIEYLLQQYRNESNLCIPYCDIDHTDMPIFRVPHGSLYGIRYHITPNFIVQQIDKGSCETESIAFSLIGDLQTLLREKGIPLFDIIAMTDILHIVSIEELRVYPNENYELYMRKYGTGNMKITRKRKTQYMQTYVKNMKKEEMPWGRYLKLL